MLFAVLLAVLFTGGASVAREKLGTMMTVHSRDATDAMRMHFMLDLMVTLFFYTKGILLH